MTEAPQLPVFVVEGTNWFVEIPIDELNVQFSYENQAYEAATKAVEVFFKIEENDTFRLKDPADETPTIGMALFAYQKDTNPDKTGIIVPAHIALANSGFYKQSHVCQTEFNAYMKEQEEEAVKERTHQQELEAQIENFEKLKKETQRKPSKGTKKKKK